MCPVNGSRLAQSRNPTNADTGRELPGQQPAQEALGADVDADHPPPAFDPGDLDLVGANEPCTVDVDQLAVEQVLSQQQLALSAFERLQVEPCLRERDPAVLDLADSLGGDVHVAAGDLCDGSADRRVLVLAEVDEQVVDLAELAAFGVVQVAADDQRQVQDGRCRSHCTR